MIPEFHHEELSSTSDEARRLLEAGVMPPFVVRADRQTAGRGRGTHVWWSDAGSLTFTVALDPVRFPLPESRIPLVSMAAAVAVIDAIEAVATVPPGTLGIRWPNDIEAAGRKLAGILPELVRLDGGSQVLLGVGLNVTTDLADAPAEVRRMATSVQTLAPEPVDRPALYHAVLRRAEDHIDALMRGDTALHQRWAALDTLKNTEIRVRQGNTITRGRVLGILPSGWLHIWDFASGEVRALTGGEILREPPPG
jgi:BirA family biotin operon repressor/biotin-[acetyl-CoA-carboxylase] ligase